MTLLPTELQILQASLQKSGTMADAGIALVAGTSTQVLRRPGPAGSGVYVVLAELTPQNVAWPEETWKLSMLRQLRSAGVGLADISLAGSLGNYARLVGVAGGVGQGDGDAAALQTQATREMMEMNQSFNMQYLMLQSAMQDESRRYTMLSNVMKTKHDTAKNSISNVR
jgi:hypothetical protein